MKHQSYIRSLFVAFCAFFVCASAMAETTAEAATVHLNPFAFKLSSSLSGDVFTVTYYLNAPATDVKVSIDINNDGKIDGNDVVYNCNAVKNTKGTTLVKGIYTATISLREKINELAAFRNKEDLHWYVDVKGGNPAEYPSKANGAVLAAQEISTNYNFYNAGSVDIDINPYSENFGLIYVLERRESATTDDYFSTKNKQTVPGIYVFDPAFQNMPATRGKYDFVNGTTYDGAEMVYSFNAAANADPVYGYYNLANLLMKARIAYDDDNETRLFVSCQTNTGPILMYGSTYYLNCTRGNLSNDWFHYIISGTRNDKYEIVSGSDFVAAPNIAFDIQGNKSSRKAMMFSGFGKDLTLINNSNNSELARDSYRCDEYNLSNYTYELKTTSNALNCKPSITGVIDLYSKNGVLQKNSWYMNTWSPNMVGGHEKMIGFNVQLDLLGLEYDESGTGFWLCQTRDHHSGMPSLTHFKYNSSTKKYEVNFIEYWANRGRSAVRYDINNNRLAVSGGKYYIKESESGYSDSKFPINKITSGGKTYYKHPAATPCYATIYTVDNSKLATNFIGDKTSEQTKAGTTVTSRAIFSDSAYVNLNNCKAADFAWDFADNLYVAMGADHKVTAFALPHKDKVVSTPCKQNYYFDSDTYLLTITIAPANTGKVLDNEFQKEYRYYMKNAKFQLLAIPETGYRFYCWDEYDIPYPQTIGATLTSEHTMTGNYNRTAHFGIDVWETKEIIQTNKEMTFRGVFVQRELDAESYSTICLPFHLESLEGTPFAGASVLEFTGATPSQEDGDNRIFLEFSEVEFASSKGMRAGVPYLIKVDEPVTGEVIFNNVTCPAIGNEGGTVEYSGVTFKGILNPTTFEASETNLFLVADDRLAVLTKGGTINGLRAYFIVPEGTKAENVSINVVNKVPTATPNISLLDSIQPTKYMWNGQIYIQRGNEVYNLSGARVK